MSALRNTGDAVERPLALAEQVLVLARRVSAANGVLTITAAYTGMRCAELAGLPRSRVDLGRGIVVLDAKVGGCTK